MMSFLDADSQTKSVRALRDDLRAKKRRR